MNGRKAKEIRALAQLVTVGQQPVVHEHKMKGTSPTATIVLGKCTRKTYKNLKKLAKSGEMNVGYKGAAQGVPESVQG